MRNFLTFALIACWFGVPATLHAQDQPDKDKPGAVTSRSILASLQHEMKAAPFAEPMKFSEFLSLAREVLQNSGKPVTILVDEEAYREEFPEAKNLFDQEINLRNLPARANMQLVLRQALKQLPMKSAYVIRGGKVEIVPFARTGKEFMLNQTFHAEFRERRLDQALDELSELTGVSIVVDARAKQKTQTPITARFNDDVAVQDAVRMLSDMAELKIVYLVTGIYVTTPERAQTMQKELKQIYEVEQPVPTTRSPVGPGPGPGPGGFRPGVGAPPDPNVAPIDPLSSPLAPPLPPRWKRVDPAA